jgi:hypothetical protein
MSSTVEWQVWCETDNKFVSGLLYESNGTPVSCFDNSAHTITTIGKKTPAIKKRNIVEITTVNEGTMTITGKYNLTHLSKDLAAGVGSVTVLEKFWDFSIGALKFSIDVCPEMKGDKFSMYINKNTIIGAITADIAVPTAWVSQNYIAGDTVTYSTSVGSTTQLITYTCIADTINNESPRLLDGTNFVNTVYWRKGLRISLSSDQIEKVNDGFLAKLTTNPTDPHNTGIDLGEIWYVDAVNNYVYVGNINTANTPITSGFTAATPTYFATGYQIVGDCTDGPVELNNATRRSYGASKIGAVAISEEFIVRIEYTNIDGVSNKRFVGEVEVLRGSGSHQI